MITFLFVLGFVVVCFGFWRLGWEMGVTRCAAYVAKLESEHTDGYPIKSPPEEVQS